MIGSGVGQDLIYGELAQVTFSPGDGKVRRIPVSEDYHHDCINDDDDDDGGDSVHPWW